MSLEQTIDASDPAYRDDARPKKIAALEEPEASPSPSACATLCGYCQDIFDHLPPEEKNKYLAKHPDLSAMRRNAESGCHLCHLLVTPRSGGQQPRGRTVESIEVFVSFREVFETGLPHWEIEISVSSPFHVGHRVHICPEESYDDNRVNLDNSIQLGRLWLGECCTYDWDYCGVNGRFLPTRLIDVEVEMPRLVLSTELEDFPLYATLSHCWGKNSFETLTRGNLDIFRQQIPAQALSRTFLDAIAVARGLGIPYIWIDSLCIMQDKPANGDNSDNDWVKESARMCDVYRHSYLNIAATGAVDGNQGLFPTQNESYGDYYHFFNTQTRIKSDRSGYVFFLGNLWDEIMCNSPLIQRAWVVQELILAPRTLHFARAELFWECNRKTACSRFRPLLPYFFYPMWRPMQKHRTKQPLPTYFWKTIVKSYSRCKLTFSSDRLVALSGLARAMSTSRDLGEYLAGLWHNDTLISHLLWKCAKSDSQDLRPRPTEYWAPTWSWLALDQPVDWYYPSDYLYRAQRRYSQVTHSERVLAGPDEFGPVSYAALELECENLLPVTTGTGLNDDPCTSERPDAIWAIGDWFSSSEFRLWFDVPVAGNQQLYLVLLLSHPMWKRADGLILKPVGTEAGCYERLGMFSTYGNPSGSGPLSIPDKRENCSFHGLNLLPGRQPAPPNLLPPTCFKRTQQAPDGSTKYVIKLV